MNTNLSFEKFAQDAHEYLNKVAEDLGHPEEKQRISPGSPIYRKSNSLFSPPTWWTIITQLQNYKSLIL